MKAHLVYLQFPAACVSLVMATPIALLAQASDPELQRWLMPQEWKRDTAGPVLSLGSPGSFDDTHIFAPCVVRENQKYWLWYCGSRGTVADRVFGLGLLTGENGRNFQRQAT